MSGVLLIGATDGIGLQLARLYARDGWNVGIIGRNQDRLASTREYLAEDFGEVKLVFGSCDVRERGAVQQVFDDVAGEMAGIDVVVFCAGVFHSARGYGLEAARELDTIDVNFGGFVSFATSATNYFIGAAENDGRRGGHIAVIGSVAGERGRKGNPAYCASKAAVDTYCEGLRARLFPMGITVTNVKPGFVNTKMLGGRARPGMIEADEAARRIKRGLDRRRDVFFVPRWWWLVSVLLRWMPRSVFKRVAPG